MSDASRNESIDKSNQLRVLAHVQTHEIFAQLLVGICFSSNFVTETHEFIVIVLKHFFYVNVDAGPVSLLVVGRPLAAIYGGLASTGLCAILSHCLLSQVNLFINMHD